MSGGIENEYNEICFCLAVSCIVGYVGSLVAGIIILEQDMNRYDWAAWALGLLVDSKVREAALEKMQELESAVFSGADKREIVVNILLPGVKQGGVFLARALIELWLGQIRNAKR